MFRDVAGFGYAQTDDYIVSPMQSRKTLGERGSPKDLVSSRLDDAGEIDEVELRIR